MSKSNDLDELADKLHSATIHLLRILRQEDAISGIGPAQLSALSVIVFVGPQSLNQLATVEEVKPPTMSRIIDAMLSNGLVRRETNLKDRRSVIISATSKGVKLMREARRRRVKRLSEILKSLKKVELENLGETVEILSNIFGGTH